MANMGGTPFPPAALYIGISVHKSPTADQNFLLLIFPVGLHQIIVFLMMLELIKSTTGAQKSGATGSTSIKVTAEEPASGTTGTTVNATNVGGPVTATALKATINVQALTATTDGVTTALQGGGIKIPHMPMPQSILPLHRDM